MTTTLLWTLFGFFCGSLPFSVWIGRRQLGRDIRDYGDHNPGATNVLRAGGRAAFLLAILLDVSKGALPVGLAHQVYGVKGWALLPIGLAPLLGHAFSPFLGGRGGKAIAATFGVWIGLTLWRVPLASMAILIVATLLLSPSGWSVLVTLVAMAGILLFWLRDPVLLGVLVAQIPILLWKQRHELARQPRLRLRRRSD